jgi:hypothetical protein
MVWQISAQAVILYFGTGSVFIFDISNIKGSVFIFDISNIKGSVFIFDISNIKVYWDSSEIWDGR